MKNCDLTRDLLPLYADECCSEESRRFVEDHLKECAECRAALEEMKKEIPAATPVPERPARRIREWQAGLLQAAMLFVSFALIVLGVALEAGTPSGPSNAVWAFVMAIPATGFMLSLGNWFFLRVYSSRRSFSNSSLVFTVFFTLLGYVFGVTHYHMGIGALLRAAPFWISFGASVVFCVLSKFASLYYAFLSGKE